MPAEQAILSELLVRGPQTVGELRTRGKRMYSFADLAAVEEVLQELIQRGEPLIALLPRQPGRKEGRYVQLFSGMPENVEEVSEARPEAARVRVVAENERFAKLEEEVSALRGEVAALQQQMVEFKAQFE